MIQNVQETWVLDFSERILLVCYEYLTKEGGQMKRICLGILTVLLGLTFFAQAQQSGGSDGVKNTCEVSGGTFTGSEGGNWACCWSDWGCYGCLSGVCKIKCYNDRCRKANGISATLSNDETKVKGLAAPGMKVPVAPKISTKMKPIGPQAPVKKMD